MNIKTRPYVRGEVSEEDGDPKIYRVPARASGDASRSAESEKCPTNEGQMSRGEAETGGSIIIGLHWLIIRCKQRNT